MNLTWNLKRTDVPGSGYIKFPLLRQIKGLRQIKFNKYKVLSLQMESLIEINTYYISIYTYISINLDLDIYSRYLYSAELGNFHFILSACMHVKWSLYWTCSAFCYNKIKDINCSKEIMKIFSTLFLINFRLTENLQKLCKKFHHFFAPIILTPFIITL